MTYDHPKPEQHGDAVVSVVVPTLNRSRLAVERARWALTQPLVREVIFVVDGGTDDTAERLREIAAEDARVRVIENERNVGLPGAKNIGVRAATSDWLLLIDDDDTPSDGLISEMLEVALKTDADVVGVPWFILRGGDTPEDIARRAPRVEGGPKPDQPGVFPSTEWAECPWISANSLIRRAVFGNFGYDEALTGNFFREETDFFVSLVRAGKKVVVTSRGYTYAKERTSGGIERRSKIRYEYSVLSNNWRFLRKHGAWLRESGYISSPARAQTSLFVKRMRPLARAAVRRLIRLGRR